MISKPVTLTVRLPKTSNAMPQYENPLGRSPDFAMVAIELASERFNPSRVRSDCWKVVVSPYAENEINSPPDTSPSVTLMFENDAKMLSVGNPGPAGAGSRSKTTSPEA